MRMSYNVRKALLGILGFLCFFRVLILEAGLVFFDLWALFPFYFFVDFTLSWFIFVVHDHILGFLLPLLFFPHPFLDY